MSAPPLRDQILARATFTGVQLRADELDRLASYYALLERWNQKINLTALPLAARENATIDRLLIEPLLAAAEFPETPATWFDFGSGGGSPAIPLKIVRPAAQLTMIEARERKSAFLREAVSTLGLEATRVYTQRLESGELQPKTADVVTIRAVKLDADVIAAAHRLLKQNGRLLLFSGDGQEGPFPKFRLVGRTSLSPSSGFLLALEKVSE